MGWGLAQARSLLGPGFSVSELNAKLVTLGTFGRGSAGQEQGGRPANGLPDPLAHARNAVNVVPALQTVAKTEATGTGAAKSSTKVHKRH